AETPHVAERALERSAAVLAALARNARARLVPRGLEEDPGRLAGRGVALDRPARRVGRGAVDPQDLERQAVQPPDVPVDARERDRMIGTPRVEHATVGPPRRLPPRLVPAEPADPAPPREARRSLRRERRRVESASHVAKVEPR